MQCDVTRCVVSILNRVQYLDKEEITFKTQALLKIRLLLKKQRHKKSNGFNCYRCQHDL